MLFRSVVMQQYSCLYGFTDKTFELYEDDVPQAMQEQVGERVALVNEMIVYGALRASTNQFYGGTGDHHPARIVGIESRDQGRTWSAPRVVIENEGGANVMSVSLLRLASGKLALFYLRKNSWLDCRPWMRTSADEGRTWSEPVLMVSAPEIGRAHV